MFVCVLLSGEGVTCMGRCCHVSASYRMWGAWSLPRRFLPNPSSRVTQTLSSWFLNQYRQYTGTKKQQPILWVTGLLGEPEEAVLIPGLERTSSLERRLPSMSRGQDVDVDRK